MVKKALQWNLVLVSVVTIALNVAFDAHAGRNIDEPAAIAKRVKAMSAATVDDALKKAGLFDECKPAMKQNDLRGLKCRVAVIHHVAIDDKAPPKNDAESVERVAVFDDLAKTSETVDAYKPIELPPTFSRLKYEALVTVSQALVRSYRSLQAVSSTGNARKDAVCGAAKRALDASVGGDATTEERGAIQSILTSNRCFLDESRLAAAPKPTALRGNLAAESIRVNENGEGVLVQYAQSRSIELSRCEKHFDAVGKIADAEKAKACGCGVMQKWKFPINSIGNDERRAKIAAGSGAYFVAVDKSGVVTSCDIKAF